jgi:hypothetical protein
MQMPAASGGVIPRRKIADEIASSAITSSSSEKILSSPDFSEDTAEVRAEYLLDSG